MLFLAESLESVESGYIKSWLIVALVLLAAIDRIYSIIQKRKPAPTIAVSEPVPTLPQPIRVIHDDKFVTVEAFDELKNKVKELTDDLPEMERRLNQKGEDRAESIHQRINPLSAGIE